MRNASLLGAAVSLCLVAALAACGGDDAESEEDMVNQLSETLQGGGEGFDEETADCFAVQRGRRQGWLTPDGLVEVCRFIAPAKGDSMHFSGSHRCQLMRQCYTDSAIK